ncbi:MAG: signal peptidase II [Turicibacter sp.]|nr:signal peptidase II [Turicibacter sp.]
MNRIRWILAGVVVILVVLDQIVKQWARDYLHEAQRLPIIDGIIGFRWATNAGAAFGIFYGGRWFFVVFTIIVIVVMLVYEFKLPYTKQLLYLRIPMVMILAGAIGNFIDRLLFGYVVDMFEFLFINFAIFNVADILLTTGTFIYIFLTFFLSAEKEDA